jgi:hypothetical protein
LAGYWFGGRFNLLTQADFPYNPKMPIRTIIGIDVNAEDLAAATAMVAKFKGHSAAISAKWSGLFGSSKPSDAAQSVKSAKEAANAVGLAAKSSESMASGAHKASGAMKTLAFHTGNVSKNIALTTFSLLKAIPLTGIIAGLVGSGVGLFGISEMARGVAERRRQALGLGASYGGVSSFKTNFARYGVGEGALSAASAATFDPTDPAFIALLTAGVKPGNDAASTAAAVIHAIPRLMAGTPDAEIGPKAEALRLTQFATVQQIIAIMHTKPEERAAQEAHYRSDVQTFNITSKSQLAWANFSTALNRAEATIEKVLASQLVGLATPFEHLSEGLAKFIGIVGDSPDVKAFLDQIEAWLLKFSDTLTSDAASSAGKSVISGLDRALGVLRKVYNFAKGASVVYGNVKRGIGIVQTQDFWNNVGRGAEYVGTSEFWRDVGKGAQYVQTPAFRADIDAGAASLGFTKIKPEAPRGLLSKPAQFNMHVAGMAQSPTLEKTEVNAGSAAVSATPPTPIDGETQDQLLARIKRLYPTFSGEACVELAKKTAGMAGSVWDWRRGDNAITHKLPVGTPVATFEDRQHNPSQFYDAHIGTGAIGANSTHAAVVAGYTKDGIILAEQYVGSHGVHLHEYKTGDVRGGEKDALHYFAVNDVNNLPAGSHNPYREQLAGASRSKSLDMAATGSTRRRNGRLDGFAGLHDNSSIAVTDTTGGSVRVSSIGLAGGV